MNHTPRHKFDVYNELYPVSAVAIIGSGIITVTMGEFFIGAAFVFSGVVVGLAGQFAHTVHDRKAAIQRRYTSDDI